MELREITEKNISELTAADRPVVLEFSAPWCVYCRRIAPALRRIAEKHAGQVDFGAVNIDDEPGLEERFNVDTVPSLFVFARGVWSGPLVAPSSQAEIEDWMRAQLEVVG